MINITLAVYTDLITSFTLGTNTNPSSTAAASLITNLYNQAADEMGIDTYSSSDPKIDNDFVKQLIIKDASQIIEKWNAALKPNSTTYMPSFELSQSTISKLHKRTANYEQITIIDRFEAY